MQTFICPDCGHKSSYDPWIESAHCPQCGYQPPVDRPIPAQPPKEKKAAHQAILDEMMSHWNGTHTPDRVFTLATPDAALAFFQDYKEATGAPPSPGAESYSPPTAEILAFVGAYLFLLRGERALAAQRLQTLTKTAPKFSDAWLWLATATDDPAKRIDYIEQAVALEPTRPLALDALVAARQTKSKA